MYPLTCSSSCSTASFCLSLSSYCTSTCNFLHRTFTKKTASIKTKPTIHIQVYHEVAACSTEWDTFLPMGHHLLSKHLQAFEKSCIEDIQAYYLLVFEQQQLIGLLYLQQFSFQHKHLNFKADHTGRSKLIKAILPLKLQLLVCGHLFRINFEGFYFKNPSKQSLLFDAIDLFVSKNKTIRPCGIMIKDCSEVQQEQRCKLYGYQFFNGDVTMELTRQPHWQCFDDYLKSLKKDYFKRAKKIILAFAGIEKRALPAEEILRQGVAIEALYWNVVNKQTIKLGTVNARYFYQLKIDLQQNFELHALYQQGVMVGFYTFIFYNGQMETHYIGLNYEVNQTAKLYFNILFAGIEKMIDRQDDTLELGRTAREAKGSSGAMPRQIFNYIKVSNPLVKITVNYFLKKFNQAQATVTASRKPFK